MSEYYKGTKGSAWNYGGGNWKLSRSKIDLYLECPWLGSLSGGDRALKRLWLHV